MTKSWRFDFCPGGYIEVSMDFPSLDYRHRVVKPKRGDLAAIHAKMPAYIRWRRDVFQFISDRTGKPITEDVCIGPEHMWRRIEVKPRLTPAGVWNRCIRK